jgi:O-antigen/teichoic acid export membrane protein
MSGSSIDTRGVDADDEEKATFARNATSQYALRALLGLSALLLTPYLFRTLGVGPFGTWSVIFTIAAVFDMLILAFSVSVAKKVAELRVRDRADGLNVLLGTAVTLGGVLGLVGTLALVIVAVFASGLAAEGQEKAFTLGMLVVAVVTGLRSPAVAYGAGLQGLQWYHRYNIARAVNLALFSLGAVVAVEAGGGVAGVSAAYALPFLVEAALFAVFLARADPALSLRPRYATPAARSELRRFSSFVLLIESMLFLGQRLDTVVIAAVRGSVAAAPFAAALKVQTALQSLTLPVLNLMMPMVSGLWALDRRAEITRRLGLASRAVLQVTLPVALGLVLFAEDAIGLWLGPTAPSVTSQIVVVMMVSQTITLTTTPVDQVLVGTGRVRMAGVLASVTGLCNFALSIFLIVQLGPLGAALGTLLTAAVTAPVKFPIVARLLGPSTGSYLARELGRGMLSSVPSVAVMAALALTLPAGPLRLLLGLGLGLAAAAAIAGWQIGWTRVLAFTRTAVRASPLPTGRARAGSGKPLA